MTACLIPVKELSTAMSRLGDILEQDDKIALSLAMLEDVIEVVSSVSRHFTPGDSDSGPTRCRYRR